MSRHRFDVWAPRAHTLRLVVGDRTMRMHRTGGGWWGIDHDSADTPIDTTDVDYGYLIDDDATPTPDPRSRRQPNGVHGLSRTFDPTAYAWRDSGWSGRVLAGSVVYELHIGTFTREGTFDAAARHLDHLVGLGVGFVEILPVNAFDGTWNWGYDGVLWYAVHEPYGGPAGYQRLVDACHAKGLAVIQDVVYNHLGPSGNCLPRFGPYLKDTSANTWGATVNLDGPGSDEVRTYILDNAAMWFTHYHVDGLRLDAVHALVDSRATTLLEELAGQADRLSSAAGRPLTLIAESDLNDPKLITSREAGGYGLDAQWDDDVHHALHANLTGETEGYYADFAGLGALAKVLTGAYFHDGSYSSFRGRHHGRPVDTLRMPTSRFVVFAQDHDQVGNRATGDRLSATLDHDRLVLAAVFTLLGPFTPMLFMGEEWGASTPWQFFTSHPEPELAEATAKGRLEEFAQMGWDRCSVPDPQDPATFHRSKLDWGEAAEPGHAALLHVYRALGELRRNVPEFTDPRFANIRVQYDEDRGWLVMNRGRIAIAANFGTVDALLPDGMVPTDFRTLFSNGDVEPVEGGIRLGARGCLVAAPAGTDLCF